MAVKRQYNQYKNTPVNKSGYLDIFVPVPVPESRFDVPYVITTAYTYRPDLLAHDLYGSRALWWIFAQRNPEVLKDPVFDFVAGTEIYLPQGANIREKLGN